MADVQRFKAGACIAIALLAGSALAVETNPTSPGMAAQQRCAALKEQTGAALGEPSARILTAALNPRSEPKVDPTAPPWMGPLPAMPEHCEVIGVMRERTGVDGRHYVVKYHLRLPLDWNGRFLFQGGGGTNGILGAANGSLQPGMPTALEQGFAVVSTDTGHDNAANNDPAKQGTVAFGHDYEARVKYAEKALDSVATTALFRSLGGPHDSRNRALYAKWPLDLGIGTQEWRIWKMGIAGSMDSINVMLGSPALSALFVTPPVDVAATPEASLRYQLDFNFDRDAPGIFATTAQFPRSGWELVGAQSTDLKRFRQHGGKLIVPQGGSDPIFSINDTVTWWRKLDAANHGEAAGFVRVYAVPGMNHCAGGPATDRYDALTAVVDWVEKGTVPDRIPAKAGPNSPWPGRTRPLCPYPQFARYRSGDVNQAGSFACEQPK
jgi:Tannase and feruloyl esterase